MPMTPTSRATKRGPVTGNVPAVSGAIFFSARKPASAIIGTIIAPGIGTILGGLAGGSAGFAGQAIADVISPPKKPSPAPAPAPADPPAPPKATDTTVQAAANDVITTNAAASGRASTILTSGLGATDPLTTTKKTLLGA